MRLGQDMNKLKESKQSNKATKSFSLKEKLPQGALLFNDDSMNGSVVAGYDEQDVGYVNDNEEVFELKTKAQSL